MEITPKSASSPPGNSVQVNSPFLPSTVIVSRLKRRVLQIPAAVFTSISPASGKPN